MNELQERIFSLKDDAPSNCSERRREPRVQADRLVYVQPADSSGEHFEEVRSMKDFSRSGFYFTTERLSYQPGVQLHVIPAFGGLNLEYRGEVVRVEPLPFGEFGVAVRLLHVENLAANTRTNTKSAFEAFALADCSQETLSQNDSNNLSLVSR